MSMCDQDLDLMLRLASKYQKKYIRDPLVIYNNGMHSRISTAQRLNGFNKHAYLRSRKKDVCRLQTSRSAGTILV